MKKKDFDRPKLPLPPLLFFWAVVISVFLAAMDGFRAEWWQLGGLVPFLLGIYIVERANRQFALAETNINTFREPGKLLTTGWFAWCRNPMYLGFLVALMGVPWLLGKWHILISPLVFYLTSRFGYIPFEEKAMLEKFGDDYKAYCQRVWRCF